MKTSKKKKLLVLPLLAAAVAGGDDADHVGSINIKARAEDKELIGICEKYPYSKKERHAAIQALQAERNREWKKEQAATA